MIPPCNCIDKLTTDNVILYITAPFPAWEMVDRELHSVLFILFISQNTRTAPQLALRNLLPSDIVFQGV